MGTLGTTLESSFCNGGGGLDVGLMLNHLWCAVGPLHSQTIFNFGVSWGGGLKPPKPPPIHTGSVTTVSALVVLKTIFDRKIMMTVTF